MSIDKVVLQVVQLLVSSQSTERERGADEITDISGSLEPKHVDLLVRLLVQLSLNEEDAACREAQLNAISDLASSHEFEKSLLCSLKGLETPELSTSELEHLAYLLSVEDDPVQR